MKTSEGTVSKRSSRLEPSEASGQKTVTKAQVPASNTVFKILRVEMHQKKKVETMRQYPMVNTVAMIT